MKLLCALSLVFLALPSFAYSTKPQLIYWYETPHYPGDGESVSNEGVLTSYRADGQLLLFALDFTTKNDDFVRLGGPLKDVAFIKGSVTLLPANDNYYGSAKALVKIIRDNGTTELKEVNCQQAKYSIAEGNFRQVECYFNGNDSFLFYVK